MDNASKIFVSIILTLVVLPIIFFIMKGFNIIAWSDLVICIPWIIFALSPFIMILIMKLMIWEMGLTDKKIDRTLDNIIKLQKKRKLQIRKNKLEKLNSLNI